MFHEYCLSFIQLRITVSTSYAKTRSAASAAYLQLARALVRKQWN